MFASLLTLFGRRARSLEAQARLTHAYKAVFYGDPSKEDQQLVLSDLANFSSWRSVCPSTVSDAELRSTEGRRAVFGRIFQFADLSPRDTKDLEEAARREAAADAQLT
jgi:hypothetical protein